MQFDVALDNGAFTTVSVVGADWSGRRAARRRCRPRCRPRSTPPSAPGNATVTVTGGNGSPFRSQLGPGRDAPAAGPGDRRDDRLRHVARQHRGRTRTASGGRQFFTGTDAASIAVDARASRATPPASPREPPRADRSTAASRSTSPTWARPTRAPTRCTARRSCSSGSTRKRRPTADQIQQTATQSVDNARSQQSGVSIDEEMTNLIEFQHGYDAAARLLTTVDSMMDTLINHTGLD